MAHHLVVSTFPNAKALPLWIAAEVGLFAGFGLNVSIDETESSKLQREKLISGDVHVAQAAVDNGLALIKGGHDAIIVMGGESGINDFIVQKDIQDFAGMRGRILAVDSPDTAYALQARRLLGQAGLVAGRDYDIRPVGNAGLRLKAMLQDAGIGGAVLNPPYSSEAQLNGMRSLGGMVALLGPYQAGGAFMLRSWAHNHEVQLDGYIKTYVSALRWLTQPGHRDQGIDSLRRHLDLSLSVANKAFDQLIDPVTGFSPDARLDMEGVANMLAIRAETEGAGGTPLDPALFIDLSYYQRAMSALA